MSKSIIALICTWVLIGLAGAFLGGYFWEKKVCKIDNTTGGNAITNVAPAATVSPASNSTSTDSNKTVTPPTNATPSTPTSNGTTGTVVSPTQQK